MRIIARRRPRSARSLAGFGALLLSALLIAACGSATPHLSSLAPQYGESRPLQPATPSPAPEFPTPRGNANSTGSFGPGINAVPSLPAGPPTAPPAPPTTAPPHPSATPRPTQPAAPPTAGIPARPVTV